MGDFFNLKIREDKVIPTIRLMGIWGIFYFFLLTLSSILLYVLNGMSTLITVNTIMAVIVLLLSGGVLLKNSLSAYLLCAIYLIELSITLIFSIVGVFLGEASFGAGLLLRMILIPFFLRGTKATIVYHKYIKKH
jgi:hypothetical protein